MIMKIVEIEILYDGIFLEKAKLKKKYNVDEMVDLIRNKKDISFSVSINILNLPLSMIFQIDIKEHWILNNILSNLNIELNSESLKIIRYINVLYSLYDNNYQFVDDLIIKNKRSILVNYTESIAYRNYIISKQFLTNLLNKKNILLCYFSIRDIIENIKVYLYLLRGAIKEEIIRSEHQTIIKYILNEEVKNEIHLKLEKENESWNFDIMDLVKRNPTLKVWNNELLEIKEINEKCNNYIHKNGFTKISPKYINENNDTELLENWYKIIKFYFTITASYDGKSIASSDCMDYIENEEEPSEECQHWIASTFQDFIDAEYINEEKNKIINQSYMDIKQKN